jgi:hypothetical protein
MCGAIWAGEYGRASPINLQQVAESRLRQNTPWVPQADFSTDAGNSDLIVTKKYPQRPDANFVACPAAKKKTKKEISFQDGWLTREGTPCHERSSRDDNS